MSDENNQEHHYWGMRLDSFVKGCIDPGDVSGVALEELIGHRFVALEAIVRAWDVHGREDHTVSPRCR